MKTKSRCCLAATAKRRMKRSPQAHVSLGRVLETVLRVDSGQEMPCELEQVAGEHGAPRVRVERFAAPPGAASEGVRALEVRDDPFDTRAEVAEGAVRWPVGGHVRHCEAEVLAEHDVRDTEGSDIGEVLPRRKASVEDDVGRDAARRFRRSFDCRHGERGVSRIAIERQQIEDETRRSCCQADLVPVQGFAPIFHDHIGVFFEIERTFSCAGTFS